MANPQAPNTNARSLLPMGPSYRREAPTMTPHTPTNSVNQASKTTATTNQACKPGNTANAKYSAASETKSPASLSSPPSALC